MTETRAGEDDAGSLPPGRDPEGFDRVLAWCIALLLAVAVLLYAPAIPYPGSLQRNAAALAAVVLLVVTAAGALAGRGLPIPPLPLATLGIPAALAFTAILPEALSFTYAPGRAALPPRPHPLATRESR